MSVKERNRALNREPTRRNRARSLEGSATSIKVSLVKVEEEKVRLYVGGLASEVSAGDLKERFAPLGKVQSIELPPGKISPGHRGFAYVDFVPATDASLRKLFSAYNGCKWRGGLLRIEKAKEHFTDRLNREWSTEEASLTTIGKPANEVEVTIRALPGSSGQKGANGNKGDQEDNGLKIFFPSLRKLKTVPLKGLGKHKRSFQRVESSPLNMLSTCACDDNMRSGLCDCSKINHDCGALKVEKYPEVDDISFGILKERERQLELLKRLFPSDLSTTSLEPQEAVTIEACELNEINEHEDARGDTENTFSEPDDCTEKVEVSLEDDSTSLALTEEHGRQLELMNRLFPADGPSTREPEQVTKDSQINMKRKRGGLGDSVEEVSKNSRNRISEENEQFERIEDGGIPEEREGKLELLNRTSPVDTLSTRVKKRKRRHESVQTADKSSQEEPDSVLQVDANNALDVLSEGDSEMTENVGNDSLPLATADEPERQMLETTAVMSNNLLEDDSEMTLNLGDDSMSLAIAEEQERKVLISMSPLDTMLTGMITTGGTGIVGSSMTEFAKQRDEEDSSHEDKHSKPATVVQTSTSKLVDILFQLSDAKGSKEKQPEEPSKWAALAKLAQFREVESTVQSEGSFLKKRRRPEAPGSGGDEETPSNPAPVFQVDKTETFTPSLLQTEGEISTGQHLDEPSKLGPKLTRAAWKSLVGETGRVVFSLRQVTGLSLPQASSPTQETQTVEDTSINMEPLISSRVLSQNQGNPKLPVSSSQKSNIGLIPPGQPRTLVAKVATGPNTPMVLSGDFCPFMKSENAEKEWLETKSELRSDYRAKHKHAARNMKKLWGKRT